MNWFKLFFPIMTFVAKYGDTKPASSSISTTTANDLAKNSQFGDYLNSYVTQFPYSSSYMNSEIIGATTKTISSKRQHRLDKAKKHDRNYKANKLKKQELAEQEQSIKASEAKIKKPFKAEQKRLAKIEDQIQKNQQLSNEAPAIKNMKIDKDCLIAWVGDLEHVAYPNQKLIYYDWLIGENCPEAKNMRIITDPVRYNLTEKDSLPFWSRNNILVINNKTLIDGNPLTWKPSADEEEISNIVKGRELKFHIDGSQDNDGCRLVVQKPVKISKYIKLDFGGCYPLSANSTIYVEDNDIQTLFLKNNNQTVVSWMGTKIGMSEQNVVFYTCLGGKYSPDDVSVIENISRYEDLKGFFWLRHSAIWFNDTRIEGTPLAWEGIRIVGNNIEQHALYKEPGHDDSSNVIHDDTFKIATKHNMMPSISELVEIPFSNMRCPDAKPKKSVVSKAPTNDQIQMKQIPNGGCIIAWPGTYPQVNSPKDLQVIYYHDSAKNCSKKEDLSVKTVLTNQFFENNILMINGTQVDGTLLTWRPQANPNDISNIVKGEKLEFEIRPSDIDCRLFLKAPSKIAKDSKNDFSGCYSLSTISPFLGKQEFQTLFLKNDKAVLSWLDKVDVNKTEIIVYSCNSANQQNKEMKLQGDNIVIKPEDIAWLFDDVNQNDTIKNSTASKLSYYLLHPKPDKSSFKIIVKKPTLDYYSFYGSCPPDVKTTQDPNELVFSEQNLRDYNSQLGGATTDAIGISTEA